MTDQEAFEQEWAKYAHLESLNRIPILPQAFRACAGRFWLEATKREREACTELARHGGASQPDETIPTQGDAQSFGDGFRTACGMIAAAIRARGGRQ